MSINVVVQNVSLIEGMAGSMRVKNLLDPLQEEGLITISNLVLAQTNERDKIGEKGNKNDVEYLYIGYLKAGNPFEVYKFYKSGIAFLKKSFKRYKKNILYNYGYPDIKNVLLLIYARSIGYKIIFDIVEDNRLANNFSGLMSKLKTKSSVFLLNQTKHLADAVLVISKHLEKRMLEIAGNKVKVYHIPITVNFKYFPNEQAAGNSSEIKIFYGGSFNLKKDGIDYLVKAFNEVSNLYPDIRLILSGISPLQREMEQLQDMIKDNDKIIYKGYLTVEEYYKVLNESDIFCMPRNNSPFAHAGFPFKLGEFLASGKAIIATRVGDINEYLEDKKNVLLIAPESKNELKDAMVFCIENKQLMALIGKEALKTAHKFFDSAILSKRLLNIFDQV